MSRSGDFDLRSDHRARRAASPDGLAPRQSVVSPRDEQVGESEQHRCAVCSRQPPIAHLGSKWRVQERMLHLRHHALRLSAASCGPALSNRRRLLHRDPPVHVRAPVLFAFAHALVTPHTRSPPCRARSDSFIGARRLHTVLERQVLEKISFRCSRAPSTPTVARARVGRRIGYVDERLGNLIKDDDLANFIL